MVDIETPVGGTIVEIHVAQDSQVSKDTYLFTIERAKTLIIVRSTVDGLVKELNVAVGDQVNPNFVAVRIEE